MTKTRWGEQTYVRIRECRSAIPAWRAAPTLRAFPAALSTALWLTEAARWVPVSSPRSLHDKQQEHETPGKPRRHLSSLCSHPVSQRSSHWPKPASPPRQPAARQPAARRGHRLAVMPVVSVGQGGGSSCDEIRGAASSRELKNHVASL